MVSDLFGEVPRENTSSESVADRVVDSSTAPTPNQSEAVSPPQSEAVSPLQSDVASTDKLLQRNENAAVQTEPSEPAPEKKIARRHGGAMPQ
jgi:glucan-binding YG repeat protein